MKKFLALAVSLAMCFSLAGCMSNKDNNNNSDVINSANYRVGVGSYTTTEGSASSVEGENGKGVVSTTYATVIFDENNIIQKVYIDEVESKIRFDSKGQLTDTTSGRYVRSKRELGDEYNMKAASGIGKEWYEQINSLESWLVGKNIKDISSGVAGMDWYGVNNDYANNVVNGAEDIGNGVVNGAKSIANGVRNGVNDMTDGNTATPRNGTTTAEGITDNTNDNGTVYNTTPNNTTNNTANNTENNMNNNANGNADNNTNNGTADNNMNNNTNGDNMNNGNTTNNNALNWEEDLKSSVTIDLKNIKIALQRAYENAR